MLDPRISEELATAPQPSFWTHETLRAGACGNGVRVGGSRRGGGRRGRVRRCGGGWLHTTANYESYVI